MMHMLLDAIHGHQKDKLFMKLVYKCETKQQNDVVCVILKTLRLLPDFENVKIVACL